MEMDNLFIIKQPPWTFLDREVNIKVVNMLNIRLGCGHFNKRLQHLHKNLHIWLQSQDVVPKALVGLIVLHTKWKMVDTNFDAKIVNEFFEKEHIPMDANKSTTEDFALEQTLIKAWIVRGYISFAALKGLSAVDIYIDALSIQLYNTSSFWTLIELFTNSLDGEEKTNLPMPKELASGTLARIVAQLKRFATLMINFN